MLDGVDIQLKQSTKPRKLLNWSQSVRAKRWGRKLTVPSKPRFLVRGWGLGTRLYKGVGVVECLPCFQAFLAPSFGLLAECQTNIQTKEKQLVNYVREGLGMRLDSCIQTRFWKRTIYVKVQLGGAGNETSGRLVSYPGTWGLRLVSSIAPLTGWGERCEEGIWLCSRQERGRASWKTLKTWAGGQFSNPKKQRNESWVSKDKSWALIVG